MYVNQITMLYISNLIQCYVSIISQKNGTIKGNTILDLSYTLYLSCDMSLLWGNIVNSSEACCILLFFFLKKKSRLLS